MFFSYKMNNFGAVWSAMFIETFIELWFSEQNYVFAYKSKDTCNATS